MSQHAVNNRLHRARLFLMLCECLCTLWLTMHNLQIKHLSFTWVYWQCDNDNRNYSKVRLHNQSYQTLNLILTVILTLTLLLNSTQHSTKYTHMSCVSRKFIGDHVAAPYIPSSIVIVTLPGVSCAIRVNFAVCLTSFIVTSNVEVRVNFVILMTLPM